MMVLNFIVFVMCVVYGIYQLLVNKRINIFAVEIMFAILNLPFAIKWLIEFFS